MKELFKNCLDVKEENGWFFPVRFTEKQFLEYKKDERIYVRSLATSSVALKFTTSAKEVKIEYEIGVKARPWACFDVVVNGVLYSYLELKEDKGVATLKLSGDKNAVTEIYLPHLVETKIKAPISSHPLIPLPKEDKKFYLALGDSITQGMVAVHPSFAYPVSLANHFGYELLNTGVGSICFNADELDNVGKEPDLITIALGCNDWDKTSIKDIGRVANEYLEKLFSLYKCRNVYAILPIWRSDEESVINGSTYKEFRAEIKKVYEKYDFIKIIDGYTLVPHDKKYFNDPGEDQCHPNETGFLYYALKLIGKIK